MGTGRTNAWISSGGGGSNFVAYIQVSTDANAQISAINLHGDVFTGTANSSGALTLTVTEPGTYTVSETGGGTATVAVIDYGVSYSVAVYMFNGYLIKDGYFETQMVAKAAVWGASGEGTMPTTTEGVYFTSRFGDSYTGIEIATSLANSQSVIASSQKIDVTNYDYMKIMSSSVAVGLNIALFNSVGDSTADLAYYQATNYNTNILTTWNISEYTGEYYVGCNLYQPSNYSQMVRYIVDFWLE